MENTSRGLTANALKLIAITAMLVDHIAWAFVPTYSPLGQIMHMIGRTTAPIMCYFIAEGYYHTKNLNNYALRLGIFAVISYFAYTFEHTGNFLAIYNAGMIFTLFLGLIAIVVCKSEKIPFVLKLLAVLVLCALSLFGDWPIFGILFILAFALNRGSFAKQALWFSAAAVGMYLLMVMTDDSIINGITGNLFQLAVLLALPLLMLYNGQRGKGGRFFKWLFYIFYPAHLIILGIIQWYIIK